jgi:hypothetical protein
MTVGKLFDVLKAVVSSPTRHSILLLGPPGVGKTAVTAQVADKLGIPCLTLALPTCEEVDLRGMPIVENGRTRWASPLPREGKGILILDELPSASRAVQTAAHHIIWSEKGSDMYCPWHVIATGNRAVDRAQVNALTAPLQNRLTTITVEPDLKGWLDDWAPKNGINPLIPGYLRWKPDHFFTETIPAEGNFPSGRAWQRASEIMSFSIGLSEERELLAGALGLGVTTEFAAYLRTARELPTVDKIRANQTSIKIPTSQSLLYAITCCIAFWSRVNEELLSAYAVRLPAEFTQLYLLQVRTSDVVAEQMRKDKHIRKWISSHQNLFTFE